MFGRRSDGKEVKDSDSFFRLIPCIMKERNDSQVFFNQDIVITAIEDYIAEKANEGIKLSLMDVIFAAIVRIIGERPRLNRFAINGRIYERNEITISIAIKKGLSDDSEETTLKVHFTGKENVFEVSNKLQEMINNNKNVEVQNGTDKLASTIAKIPTGLIKFTVGLLKWMDKNGFLPKSIINVSPFHTSAFVTNVGSIGIDSIYHHLYNFGTTSMFFAIGKKKKTYIFTEDEILKEKCINLAFVGDERICDGYYYAYSFRLLNKYLTHPELLEKNQKHLLKNISK